MAGFRALAACAEIAVGLEAGAKRETVAKSAALRITTAAADF